MLGNLHPRHRSKYCSVHLAAMCNRRFISKYSMNTVLAPLIEELKKLVSIHVHVVLYAYVHVQVNTSCNCNIRKMGTHLLWKMFQRLFMEHLSLCLPTTLLVVHWEDLKSQCLHSGTAGTVKLHLKRHHLRYSYRKECHRLVRDLLFDVVNHF